MPLHVSSTCALHSLWYHHTYRCDDTRDCVMQFWPPDDEHMCSKYVEAWNKLIVKQKFCVSSWLIIEINILRCTVSKTSKFDDKSIARLRVLFWSLHVYFNGTFKPINWVFCMLCNINFVDDFYVCNLQYGWFNTALKWKTLCFKCHWT